MVVREFAYILKEELQKIRTLGDLSSKNFVAALDCVITAFECEDSAIYLTTDLEVCLGKVLARLESYYCDETSNRSKTEDSLLQVLDRLTVYQENFSKLVGYVESLHKLLYEKDAKIRALEETIEKNNLK